MVVISTLLNAIANILHMVITLYIWVIIVAALISWVRPDPFNPIVQTLYRLTEPSYRFVRRFIPTIIGGVDLAPLLIILALEFIDMFFVRLLLELAFGLK
jgi:YggT family protein